MPGTPLTPQTEGLAIVLDGGGARAAYQVGLLRSLGRHYPGMRIPIITGVSAGAINAAFIAGHPSTLDEAAEQLTQIWSALSFEHVFRVDWRSLAGNLGHWASRLVAGGRVLGPPERGLVDSSPLRATLERSLGVTPDGEIEGIARNIDAGRLDALAIMTSSYTTGRSVAWVQGRREIEGWDSLQRQSVRSRITVQHVMASAALPLLFPARRLDGSWHGDGGILLSGPLSPALHLGASRILAISTRSGRPPRQTEPAEAPHPSPLEVAGQLLDAVFIDEHDHDAFTLTRINSLVRELPPERRHGLRPVGLMLIRPSVNLGRLAAAFEPRLPRLFRYLMAGLGSRESSSSDLLSLLMFDPEYLARLIALGEADAEARLTDLKAFLTTPTPQG